MSDYIYFGTKRWCNSEGELHRLDGPAMEWADGSKFWCFEGKAHRLDGPAIEWANGNKAWCFGGKLHRIDGPAIECPDGGKEWWYYGKQIKCSSTNEFIKLIKLRMFW